MWNLGEPGFRFRAAAPNHPEALLKEHQAFQAVGEKKSLKSFSFSLPHGKEHERKRRDAPLVVKHLVLEVLFVFAFPVTSSTSTAKAQAYPLMCDP